MAERFTLILSNQNVRERAHKLIDSAPDRAVMTISEPRRSNEASAKMWAMLGDIAKAKPQGRDYPAETWKCLVLDDLGYKAKWVPSLDGEGVVNTGYRSSRLTKAQMSDVIERLYQFAAENGIALSEKNPYE